MLNATLLSSFPIFSDFPPDRLAEVATEGKIMQMNPSDVIFRMNETADSLYGVIEGDVALTLTFKEKKFSNRIEYEKAIVTKTQELEREIEVDSIGPGEVFGWSAFIRNGKWTTSARCTQGGRIFQLPVNSLNAWFENDALSGYRLIGRLYEIVSKRLSTRTARLIEAWGEAFEVSSI
ncbi:MAG: cyclic nucleotide-binding domain-containing protein [Desulfobacterales bacterium]|jgi:CRP-like cAMP-binding protein|nr:cyclic nucleotide-binding domain-containing protein [Desulfobacterales bacterium]